MMIFFYNHYFGAKTPSVSHKEPYILTQESQKRYQSYFLGTDYRSDMRVLKEELALMGYAIPTLYKQYTEICEDGGVEFMDFGYDREFNDCIDGFIVVDMQRLKPAMRKRYIGA